MVSRIYIAHADSRATWVFCLDSDTYKRTHFDGEKFEIREFDFEGFATDVKYTESCIEEGCWRRISEEEAFKIQPRMRENIYSLQSEKDIPKTTMEAW